MIWMGLIFVSFICIDFGLPFKSQVSLPLKVFLPTGGGGGAGMSCPQVTIKEA